MKALERRDYFPTLIFQGETDGDESFRAEVVKSVYGLQSKDAAASTPSEEKQGHWRSAKNLHKNASFRPLRDEIQAALDLLSAELRYSKQHILKVTSMWANVLSPGYATKAECRPGNLWTGYYCAQVPTGAGGMKFIDPRTINIMNPPKYEGSNKLRVCMTKVEFKPKPGHLAVFPAWLYHEIEANLSKENGQAGDFVFISFNAVQNKR